MDQKETMILQPILDKATVRRRALLPVWMKIFTWFFMIAGAIIPFVLIIGLAGGQVQLALYGLQTNEAFSPAGLLITILFIIKGLAAFGLWTEKDWAITVATTDAMLGIAVCSFLMLLPLIRPSYNFSFRLELALLIPYLVKLKKIGADW